GECSYIGVAQSGSACEEKRACEHRITTRCRNQTPQFRFGQKDPLGLKGIDTVNLPGRIAGDDPLALGRMQCGLDRVEVQDRSVLPNMREQICAPPLKPLLRDVGEGECIAGKAPKVSFDGQPVVACFWSALVGFREKEGQK